jgi:hypothetical protein
VAFLSIVACFEAEGCNDKVRNHDSSRGASSELNIFGGFADIIGGSLGLQLRLVHTGSRQFVLDEIGQFL